MSSPKSRSTKDNELEDILIELEQSLKQLQQRHAQVKRDWQTKVQLLERKEELTQKQQNNLSQEPIKTELRHLQKEVERLDLNLESCLLPDIFWQVVRFVFLGIIIGWVLNSWI